MFIMEELFAKELLPNDWEQETNYPKEPMSNRATHLQIANPNLLAKKSLPPYIQILALPCISNVTLNKSFNFFVLFSFVKLG